MIKGWRVFFYAVIGIAVLSIAWITISFIATERLVEATGDTAAEARQRAAKKVMGRNEPIDFLEARPHSVRDNVVWSLEKLALDGDAEAVDSLVQIACDLSGELPTGDADSDAARLAVVRLGDPAVEPLIERLGETTMRTLEIPEYANRRKVAAYLLGRIGAESAIEPLKKALRDEFLDVRQQAAAALARYDSPAVEEALEDYLRPLQMVLDGQYACYVRVDTEGRVRTDPNREDLLYGPFVVDVKPHEVATAEDLARQRDSAEAIIEAERKRMEASAARQKEVRGQVIKPDRGPIDLAITEVALVREGLEVEDPAGKSFDVIEGEPVKVQVTVTNKGPGDLISDFFVGVYAASPLPRNHIDRPEEGPFEGERAADNRALAGVFEERHVRSMYHVDQPMTEFDDRVDTVTVSAQFNSLDSDRIEALRRLREIGHESVIEAVVDTLDDNSYTVRRQAVRVLSRILQAEHTSDEAKQRAAELLRQKGLSSSDPVVRCLAADVLRLSGDTAAGDQLLALLLSDPDPTVRLVATRALAGLPNYDQEKMLPALVSPDPGVRLVAPRLFNREGNEAVLRRLLFSPDTAVAREVLRTSGRMLEIEHLVAALQLPDPRTRAMAARLLAQRADLRSREALLRALQDASGEVRAAAARGLGKLLEASEGGDEGIIDALVRVIEGEAGDYVGVPAGEEPEDPTTAVTTDKRSRAAAVAALKTARNPEAQAALIGALTDTNPDVIAAALEAAPAGRLGEQTERLVAILEDVKLPGRVRQAAALGMWHAEINSEEALDALVGLLNDPNEGVKTAAAVALIGLGDDRGEKVLRDQLRSKSPEVKREAARLMATLPQERVDAIGGLKDEERVGRDILIEELYQSGSLPVNFRFLCNALVSLGDQPETVARMEAALDEAHPVLRAAALKVLTDLGAEGISDEAVAMLEDRNEVVRAAAVEAVAQLGLEDHLDEVVTMANHDIALTVQDSAREAMIELEQ